jgi:homogentisate 1,2-dioxygenase
MFESRWRFHLTEWAQREGARDAGYADCWAGLQDHFKA